MNNEETQQLISKPSGSLTCLLSFVLGIIAGVLAIVGFFPCIGWLTLILGGILAIIAILLGIFSCSRGSTILPVILSTLALILSLIAGIVQFWGAKTTSHWVSNQLKDMDSVLLESGISDAPSGNSAMQLKTLIEALRNNDLKIQIVPHDPTTPQTPATTNPPPSEKTSSPQNALRLESMEELLRGLENQLATEWPNIQNNGQTLGNVEIQLKGIDAIKPLDYPLENSYTNLTSEPLAKLQTSLDELRSINISLDGISRLSDEKIQQLEGNIHQILAPHIGKLQEEIYILNNVDITIKGLETPQKAIKEWQTQLQTKITPHLDNIKNELNAIKNLEFIADELELGKSEIQRIQQEIEQKYQPYIQQINEGVNALGAVGIIIHYPTPTATSNGSYTPQESALLNYLKSLDINNIQIITPTPAVTPALSEPITFPETSPSEELHPNNILKRIID